MMYNMITGHNGIQRRSREDIVIFVSSLRQADRHGMEFVFTDQHANSAMAEYYTSLDDLQKIDWPLLQNRDFQRDPEDPGKGLRYQAEALLWKHVPLTAITGLCCYSSQVKAELEEQAQIAKVDLRIAAQPSWYFPS